VRVGIPSFCHRQCVEYFFECSQVVERPPPPNQSSRRTSFFFSRFAHYPQCSGYVISRSSHRKGPCVTLQPVGSAVFSFPGSCPEFFIIGSSFPSPLMSLEHRDSVSCLVFGSFFFVLGDPGLFAPLLAGLSTTLFSLVFVSSPDTPHEAGGILDSLLLTPPLNWPQKVVLWFSR